jgi:hypothetical protein
LADESIRDCEAATSKRKEAKGKSRKIRIVEEFRWTTEEEKREDVEYMDNREKGAESRRQCHLSVLEFDRITANEKASEIR